MQRDLGLTADQARDRVAGQARATELESRLSGALSSSFGGAWYDAASNRLVVGVTDAAKVAQVTAAGAQAKIVAHSQRSLDGAKAALDQFAAPASVTGWYVDTMANRLVVEVNAASRDAAADRFANAARALTDAVSVVEVGAVPVPLYNVRGGDAWYGPGFRCSVAFSATDSRGGKHYITAGHCTEGGGAASGYNQVAQGTINGSTFGAGGDFGKVDVTSSQWTLTGKVNHYGGADVSVKGSTETAVGGSICRSGSTTGWHCGTVQAKNQTVNYPQRTVRGLTRTNVCAEPGDSGGSWITGTQAQGITSGGSGNCTSGGTTFFQPINKALSSFGLRLVTS
ncbi:S1 family peptidase [Solihabitans fulvus]|nr:S1 family peptidase [Solihabitans fulvus]